LNQIFIDTGFILALVNKKDQYHQKAIELANKFESNSWLMTEAVLLEIGNALARSYKQEAVEFIERSLASDEVEIVKISPYFFAKALGVYKSYTDKDWGLVDCFSFAVMGEKGVNRALSFDEHFVQAGFQVLKIDSPLI